MPEKISRIAFAQLPQEIQKKIQEILKHREQIESHVGGFGLGFGTMVLGGVGILARGDVKNALAMEAVAILGLGVPGAFALRTHKKLYSKEELGLYRALKNSSDAKVNSLLSSSNFVIVNKRGDLVAKNWNPKIGFVPIGRRRIPTPQNRPGVRKFLQKSD